MLLIAATLAMVLAMHLLAMNVASGAPFVAIWLAWRAHRRGDSAAGEAARGLVRAAIITVLAGLVLGGILLALVAIDSPEFFATARRIPASRYWFGIVEVLFYIGCLAIYLGLARRGDEGRGRGQLLFQILAALLAGTDLVYHFPPLFAVIGVLGTRPHEPSGAIRFVQAMFDPEVVAVVVHFLLASLAVTGLTLAIVVNRRSDRYATVDAQRLIAWGGRIALAATIGQLPAGLWLLFQVPSEARDQLFGEDVVAASCFAVALIATLGLLHHLAAMAFGDTSQRQLRAALVLLGLTVASMVGAQQRIRRELQGRFPPPALVAEREGSRGR
jgi:hypothetical protein